VTPHQPLPPREQQLLEFLRTRVGRVVTRDEISLGVWGFALDHRSRVIDQTISCLRRKLPPGHRIITISGVGYRYDQI
jgi:two-component system, OmpR family, phosphate regulon response regulator PhoB